MTAEEEKIIRGQVALGNSIWMMIQATGWGEKRVRSLLAEAGLSAPKPRTKRQVYARFNQPCAQ